MTGDKQKHIDADEEIKLTDMAVSQEPAQSSKTGSYEQIFKAISIFGGVQVVNIIILVIRSKVIAIFLGPVGMGISSLLTSSASFATALTNFGLGRSAVKNVASAYGSGDEKKLAEIVAVFRKLVWITGMLGFIVVLVLAPWLSELSFGNKNYTYAFMLISVTLLFTQISEGQTVILRGTRKIQYLAKSSMMGALLGLIVSLPLYYFWHTSGITPAIILTAVITLLVTFYYSRKVKIDKVATSSALIKDVGREMLTLGFLISVSSLITLGASYLMRIFISNTGSVADVGLYNAGFTIIETYVGLVFTAMSTDYYPRLAAVATDNVKCRQEINQQSEIALLILAPILIVFLVFIHFGIILLYSKVFISIISMVQWASLGFFFKASSWAIGIIFIAKGDSKMFFWNEVVANIYMLALNIGGYYYWGLTGLGISFLIGYALHMLQMYVVSKKYYEFEFSRGFLRIFLIQMILAVLCFIVVKCLSAPFSYIIGSVLIAASVYNSWVEMDKRTNLSSVLKKVYNQKIRK